MTADAFCGSCGKPRPTKPVPHCNNPTCTWWRCKCSTTNTPTGNYRKG